jgi:hypothetical protein
MNPTQGRNVANIDESRGRLDVVLYPVEISTSPALTTVPSFICERVGSGENSETTVLAWPKSGIVA